MAETIIDRTIKFILKWEQWKSYENNELVAIWGVDKRFWPKEFEQLSKMNEADSKTQAGIFYMVNFWTRGGCDDLPTPLNAFHCDAFVNSERIAKLCLEQTKVPSKYLLYRIREYALLAQKDETKRQYLRGWINRCMALWDEFGETPLEEVANKESAKVIQSTKVERPSIFTLIKDFFKLKKAGESMKSGAKTSEFFMVLIVMAILFCNDYFALNLSVDTLMWITGIALGWVFSRTGLKVADVFAEAKKYYVKK